jgi:tetratricopeptide (TPR) repeat protein
VNYDSRDSSMADYAESLQLLRQVGDLYSIGIAENNVGDLELLTGNHEAARPHIEAAIAISRELEDTSIVYCYLNLGSASLLGGDIDSARASYLDAIGGARRTGDQFVVANATLGFALCLSAEGHDEEAAELHGVADALLAQVGAVLEVGEARRRTEDHARLAQRMGEGSFEAAYRAGQSLPAVEGIAEAMASGRMPRVAGERS